MRAQDTRDLMGRVTDHIERDSTGANTVYEKVTTYDNAHDPLRELSDVVDVLQSDGSTAHITTHYDYRLWNAATHDYSGVDQGVVTHTYGSTLIGSTSTNQNTVYGYDWWDGPQQKTIDYDADTADSHDPTNTTYNYDFNGHLNTVVITDAQPRTVTYLTDATGQILSRMQTEGGSGSASTEPEELFFYFDGMRVGDVGNNGASDTDYVTAINQRSAAPQPAGDPWKTGSGPTKFGDFDQSYDSIDPTSSAEAATASRYSVRAGDTLMSIAQQVWGDSSLWYMLADANGLSGSGYGDTV